MNRMNRTMWILRFIAMLFGVAVWVQPSRAGNLPLPPGEARTPDTRTLTTEEAARAGTRLAVSGDGRTALGSGG